MSDELSSDDLITEIRARLKADEDFWPALLEVVQEHVVEVVPKPDEVPEWTDEWIAENKRGEVCSVKEIFGRPLQDVPLDDLIAELQARRKEGPEVWLALRKMIFEQIADFAQRPTDAPKWRDEWVKENTWDLVTDIDDVEITDGSGNVFDDLGIEDPRKKT
ncbi:hypothetical protein [Ruegeria faecimaris]|uniref:hypothetical protein n=1 Tax=Ruegeria faecimaris TaxID=686389 RepID=UPI0024916BDD|nr:hypothetical protein [Ruegeria faecimaris]